MDLEKDFAQKDLELKLQLAREIELEALLVIEKQKSEEARFNLEALEEELVCNNHSIVHL